jgi:hypothetical protein
MTLAPPGPVAEPHLPVLLLPADLRLTPEQFAQVCAANPEAVLELDASGRLIRMGPPAATPAPAIRPLEPCSDLPSSRAAWPSRPSTAPPASGSRTAPC